MELFTAEQRKQLIDNGRASRDTDGIDHVPVVKLFLPEGAATWLLTEIAPDDLDIAFGLCDLGMGEPEIGYVSIAELKSLRTPRLHLPIERDLHITLDKPLSVYAKHSRVAQRIVTEF